MLRAQVQCLLEGDADETDVRGGGSIGPGMRGRDRSDLVAAQAPHAGPSRRRRRKMRTLSALSSQLCALSSALSALSSQLCAATVFFVLGKKQAKRNLKAGMVVSFAMMQGAFAVALKGAETVRTAMTEADKKAHDKNSIEALIGLTVEAEILGKSAETLNRISGGDASEFKAALKQSRPFCKNTQGKPDYSTYLRRIKVQRLKFDNCQAISQP